MSTSTESSWSAAQWREAFKQQPSSALVAMTERFERDGRTDDIRYQVAIQELRNRHSR